MKSTLSIYFLYVSQHVKETIDNCLKNEHYLELKKVENKPELFINSVLQNHPDLVIIENNFEDESFLNVLEQLSQKGVKCIVFSESDDSNQILSAFRKGASEYLVIGHQLEQSLKSAIIRLSNEQTDNCHNKIFRLALIGAKGGTGVSHLSVNLAWVFSHTYHLQTILMDLDISGAKDAFMLDLVPEKTLLEFASEDTTKKQPQVHPFLTHVSPHLSLLPLPENPVDTENITPEHVQFALNSLESHHEILIMDLSHHLSELTLLGIDSSHAVILLMEPTVMSAKAGIQKIQLLEKMGYEREQIHVVINRYDRKQALSPNQLLKTLNLPVFEWLPNDEKRLTQAENIGKPVCFSYPRCRYAKKIDQIADKLLIQKEDKQ